MRSLIRICAGAAIALPLFASAQTTDITAQAQALLLQIQQLQAQLGGAGAASTGACYSGGAVKPGASGAAVTALQEFLASDPTVYPEGKITGYYGALTQKAVQRWQLKHNIVSSGTPSTTGYGSVGPRTAAAMALNCGGSGGSDDPVVGGFIKVSPVEGSAPLAVTAEVTLNSVKSCAAAIYTLSWGDNSLPITVTIPAGTCNVLAQTYMHTYQIGGQYQIQLSSGQHNTSTTVNVAGNGTMMTSGTLDTSLTGGSSTGGSSTGGSSGATQTASGALSISMNNNAFSPSTVTVTSGTRITWTNNDSAPHTVTADNGSYNSGAMSNGQTYALTFTAKGEYTYYCAIHGAKGGVGMSGKIIVQ